MKMCERLKILTLAVKIQAGAHAELLRKISESCDSVKGALNPIVSYLSSRKLEQFRTQSDAAVDRLNAVTDRAKKNSNEAEQKAAERQQEVQST